jgi:hypothetical protein
MEIVRPMAGRLARQFRVTHELEDVIRVGVLGLVKAATTYSPSKGTERFWAWSRVRLEILSAYACGKRQHSGGDGYQWNACRRPLIEAAATPNPPETPETPPLPCYPDLTPAQQLLLTLLYEDGRSERAIAQERLAGIAGRREVRREHAAALERLRQVLATPAA